MRRFLITSAKFQGTAEVLYNDDGRLCTIDIRGSEMNDETIAAFKRAVPVYVYSLEKSFGEGSVVVESDYEVSFDDFIREYPYKRNTHLAREYWHQKMNKADQVKAFFAAIDYRKYCDREATWYKPKIAEGWLRKKEFLNDWKNAGI